MVREWKNAKYICINAKEAYAPEEIKDSSICIQADIGEVLKQLRIQVLKIALVYHDALHLPK